MQRPVAGAPVDGEEDKPVAGDAAATLQRTCGVTAIGTPTGCLPASGDAVGDRVLFQRNCDDFASGAEQQRVEDFADSMLTTDVVKVHGFASIEGQLAYNENLSCARALRAVGVLTAKGIPASRIQVFMHGPKPGAANLQRAVVLERDPPVDRAVVPQLTPAVTIAPTPGICGDMNFVITWQLSRNAGPQGGFIIQDVLFVWNVIDCNGVAVPNPDVRTSPLRYFEAWQVAPNSTSLSPITTDTFSWPGATPWGGGCTDGQVFIIATARYHDDVPSLPAHMVVNNGATFAGGLQSSVTDPALGGNTSNPVAHQLVFHWTCCPCSSSPTVVDAHTP